MVEARLSLLLRRNPWGVLRQSGLSLQALPDFTKQTGEAGAEKWERGELSHIERLSSEKKVR